MQRNFGNLKKPPAELILKWIARSWEAVLEELVRSSFKTCGISNALDDTEDNPALRHLRGRPDLEVMDDVHVEEGESGYINAHYDAFIDMDRDVADDEEADVASLAADDIDDAEAATEAAAVADEDERGRCRDCISSSSKC
ncbi:hypothetical protein CLOP_g20344 [Closterium sp. NIES-67]|nr:hypothetical protein CLOP_g20344 [Closterium sp. NIES-67]